MREAVGRGRPADGRRTDLEVAIRYADNKVQIEQAAGTLLPADKRRNIVQESADRPHRARSRLRISVGRVYNTMLTVRRRQHLLEREDRSAGAEVFAA